jgi:stage V sporulation protein G
MDITKVSLRPVAMNKVCAIASIVLDDQFVIHDLRVVNGDKGLFVAMPSRKLPNGEFRDICHPINTDTRTRIQEAVLEQFATDGGIEAFQAAASRRRRSSRRAARAGVSGRPGVRDRTSPRPARAFTSRDAAGSPSSERDDPYRCLW